VCLLFGSARPLLPCTSHCHPASVLVLSPVSVFHIHPHLYERERAREHAYEKPTIPFDSLQLLEESHEEFEFGFCFARCHCHCPAVTVHRAGLGYAFSKHISANTKATRTKKKKKTAGKWPRRQRNTYTPRSAATFWSTCHQSRSFSHSLPISLSMPPFGGLLFL